MSLSDDIRVILEIPNLHLLLPGEEYPGSLLSVSIFDWSQRLEAIPLLVEEVRGWYCCESRGFRNHRVVGKIFCGGNFPDKPFLKEEVLCFRSESESY